jgi:hypothetical protein
MYFVVSKQKSLMRIIVLSVLLLVGFKSFAGIETEKSMPDFVIVETTVNTQLIPQQCQVKLDFYFGDTTVFGRPIYMSINGVLENLILTGSPVLYDLTPGKYVFKIWGGPGFDEIITDSIEFKSQTVSTARIQIREERRQIEVMKPVIYFHTDKGREVSVVVRPAGKFTFTYPEIGAGWNGKLNIDGSFSMNGINYPYLFWESNQSYSFKPVDNGFKVDRNNIVTFLEQKCAEFGFNQQEKTDFITFWGPQLAASESVFVQFNMNESCNQFAELEISPAPKSIQRVYIEFTAWSDVMDSYLKDKTFEPISESGFSVLEWGGFQFSLPATAYLNN